jgi:hypothetical protein
MANVKFMWNGIKVDGKLYRAWYSEGELIGKPKGTLSIYGRDYVSFPKIEGLNIENDTDWNSDYFCDDKIRVAPDNEHYPAILEAIRAEKERREKKILPREAPAGSGPVDKLQAFAAAVEAAELESLKRRNVDCESNRIGAKVSIKPGKKYTKVDVGSSGRFMIDQDGNIWGIKSYGVPHFGHNYGTLDKPVISARF